MTGRRVTRSRVLAVVAATVALLLAGSVSAWAYWVASTTATASAAGPTLAAPGTVTVTCNPQINLQNDPATVTWSTVPVPTGATAVRYRVLFTNDAGGQFFFPSSTTETTGTSLTVNSTQLGTTTADRQREQTISVQAIAVYPAGKLESAAATAAVQVHGEAIFTYIDLHCS
jgi:hypothetical protein